MLMSTDGLPSAYHPFLLKNILSSIHELFLNLCPIGINPRHARLSVKQMCSLPALQVNPFRDRICKVFSGEDGTFSFENFLEMASVLSEQAPFNLKIKYAFRVYDFNENDYIDEDDITTIIHRLTNTEEIEENEIIQLIDHVLDEADLDNDSMLSFEDFEIAMSKIPDFLNSFRINF
uniref:Calcium and integrin-binding family member 4 isoform X2 n=1 Tax=Geotrypetes seraphini TaxID=260995 RepID=A0A6P8Q6X4_GEOSA|nr:calcium and integrin-binding family member 4 isoform X2 [Geotrypetes seraphini]XP_033795418.1 calcium and integrin-binding family member 4 isoform X2 [Geotrypetes seraphini]XP_033795419.1 calcium and integrin-binding family member 4 isoform X2 [Geotrypetes seraphini]